MKKDSVRLVLLRGYPRPRIRLSLLVELLVQVWSRLDRAFWKNGLILRYSSSLSSWRGNWDPEEQGRLLAHAVSWNQELIRSGANVAIPGGVILRSDMDRATNLREWKLPKWPQRLILDAPNSSTSEHPDAKLREANQGFQNKPSSKARRNFFTERGCNNGWSFQESKSVGDARGSMIWSTDM